MTVVHSIARTFLFLSLACLAFGLAVTCFAQGTKQPTPAPPPVATKEAAKPAVAATTTATTPATAEEYKLVYKFGAGELVQSKVTQLVTVETKIRGVEQVARTRSVSTKSWRIETVEAGGNIRFTHYVDDVDMWQSVTGRQEIKYNSQTDKTPPPGYETVADSVGKALATVTISPTGKIISRENAQKQFNPGIGELTVPLPDGPVKIGAEWTLPDEVSLREADGAIKKINLRQVYRLLKVETGIATIQVDSQVLTPLNDAKMQTELVQRLQKGIVKFDIDAGRLMLKQMDMNETVLGFNGADSSMHYVARLSEAMNTETEVAAKPKPASPAPSSE